MRQVHPRLLTPCLLLLTLSGQLAAVELPIVSITIGPEGALVERAGEMPRGDEVVTGLPIGIDPTRLTLTVEGLDTPPALRLDMPVPAPLPLADPAWLARLASAQADFDAAQPALDLADFRMHLAEAVLNLFPQSESENTKILNESGDQIPGPEQSPFRPSTVDQVVPNAVTQNAVVEFVTTNITTAQTERATALRARSVARSQLIALDEERERQRPVQRLAASVHLPGAAGRIVRLRYVVERAAWAPAYRIDVANGVANLIHEAIIDVPALIRRLSIRLDAQPLAAGTLTLVVDGTVLGRRTLPATAAAGEDQRVFLAQKIAWENEANRAPNHQREGSNYRLRNLSTDPITFACYLTLPVSAAKGVTVTPDPSTTPGWILTQPGIQRWELTVKPGTEFILQHGWTVDAEGKIRL